MPAYWAWPPIKSNSLVNGRPPLERACLSGSQALAYTARMSSIVDEYAEELATLARRYGVARLEIFGSAATGEFDPETSDLDFLVEFQTPGPEGKFNDYFGLLNELTELFGRPVDLVSTRAIKNPYFLESVNETRRPVYVA